MPGSKPKIAWDDAKLYWLSHDVTYADVAKKFSCSEAAVKKAGVKYGWAESKGKVELATESIVTEAVAQEVARKDLDPRLRHARIAEMMLVKVEAALMNDRMKLQTPRDIKEMALAAVTIHRQALQIDQDKPQSPPLVIVLRDTQGNSVNISRV